MYNLYKISIALILITLIQSLPCNVTTGNYLSPHSLGKQDQMNDALKILCDQIRIPNTTYTNSSNKITFLIYNISVKCIYNDGKQIADIKRNDAVSISGGKIQFLVNFNYSSTKSGPDQFGYVYSSAFSDIIAFQKQMTINFQGYLQWILAANTSLIAINSSFPVKRIAPGEPTAETLDGMDQILNKATDSISPGTIKSQILKLINQNYISVLNKTLMQETIFTNSTNYSFQHPTKGKLTMSMSHSLFLYNLTAADGFTLEYLTTIINETKDFCTGDIPKFHDNFDDYGGIQTIHSLDLYVQIAKYYLKNKWFDTTLGSTWDTNSFQFFAGDLYQIIPKVQTSIPPRTRLSGMCTAQNDNFFNFKRANYQTFSLTLNYSCYLETADTGRKRLSEFNLFTTFIIVISLQYQTIKLNIRDASATTVFNPVNGYIVTDPQQATFKINQALKQLKGLSVFGSGFPAWPRDLPGVQVRKDYVFFFDSSHIPHLDQEIA